MTHNKTAIVCDDHPLFRSGVVSCLSDNPGIEVVAEASDGESCIAKMKIFKPDILIVDLSIPAIDGFDVLAWVRENQPNTQVFILSMHAEISYVQKAKDLGANGFMAKEDAQSELLAAITSGPKGFYTSESIGKQSRENLPRFSDYEFAERLRKVSDAEKKVLVLLTQSMTSREIAEELHLSVRTIQAHRVSLADKLNAKGPNKLLELAVRHQQTILDVWSVSTDI
jgi:DNA-binding NarL/FixJ family response regulator